MLRFEKCRMLLFLVAVGGSLLLTSCGKKQGETPSRTSAEESSSEKAQSERPKDCPENVVALVDDRVITLDDAEKRAAMTLRRRGVDESDPDYPSKLRTARKGAVDHLIEAYVLQAAATDTVVVTTKEVEDELLKIKMRHPSRESYEEGLRRAGLTEEKLKEILNQDIRIRKTMALAAARGVPTPTPEDAKEFYETNTLAFAWPYRVRYDEIIWPLLPDISDASLEQAQQEMENLADRIGGKVEVFDEILRSATSTTWGYVGLRHPFVNVKDLEKPIQDTLQLLDTNEPSRPIRISTGISIICIRATRQTYESAYQEILQSIYEARLVDNLEKWRKQERAKHRIRICDLDYYEGKGKWAIGSATSEKE